MLPKWTVIRTRANWRLLTGLLLFWLMGCQQAALPQTAADPPAPTATAVLPAPETPTPISTLPPTAQIDTPTAVPSPTIIPTPTPSPWRIGQQPGLPPEIGAALAELAASQPAQFTLADDEGDVTVTLGGETSLATWVYAIAAPFPTLDDGLSWDEVQEGWENGRFHLTPDVADTLRGWWGDPGQPPIILPADELVDALWSAQTGYDDLRPTILPFDQLEPRLKALRLEGIAPIEPGFDPAGYPLALPIGLEGNPDAIAALQTAWDGPLTNRDETLITTVAMTGPAGMRRAVADRMERYGITYPSEETGPVLQAADFAHMSNENPFAPNCPMPDPNDSDNVCNRDEYVELMVWLGINIVEMTGNHLNDWGTWALNHTFDLYDSLGMQTFGGGRNLEHARQPLLIEHNGNRLAFVGCNPVGPAFGWATETQPGALPCEEDYAALAAQIRQLADEGYLVIATLQYLEDYQYHILPQQHAAFRALADAGATAVSGSHAHHPQGFAFRPNGSFIHYGLGNFLADQMWMLGVRQTFVDTYLFYNGRLLHVDLWTGLIEDYARQRLMTPEERRDLLRAVFETSDWQ